MWEMSPSCPVSHLLRSPLKLVAVLNWQSGRRETGERRRRAPRFAAESVRGRAAWRGAHHVEKSPDLRGVPVADVAVEVSGASELRRAARELRRAGARG